MGDGVGVRKEREGVGTGSKRISVASRERIQVDILPYVIDSVCGVELGYKPSAVCQTNLYRCGWLGGIQGNRGRGDSGCWGECGLRQSL